MAVFNADLLDSKYGLGGIGPYVNVSLYENPYNLTGRMGGRCVQDGRFREGQVFLNMKQPKGESDCLRRDFIPWIMNYFGCYSLVEHPLSQPDYTTFAWTLKNIPNFSEPNIHGSGHFGIGGVLGTLANSALSPGGKFKKSAYM
jgi:tyrosinase